MHIGPPDPLFQPYWSSIVIEELERVLIRQGKLSPEAAARLTAQLDRAFPEALVEGFEHLAPAMANDLGDRHVAAAATLVGAQAIVTANVRHFVGLPPTLEILTPDAFLITLLGRAPAQIDAILHDISADYRNPPLEVSELIARLGAVAPAFAAALALHLQP